MAAYTVGAREVISSHDLHVGLLQQRYPEFILVGGVGAEQLPIAAQW